MRGQKRNKLDPATWLFLSLLFPTCSALCCALAIQVLILTNLRFEVSLGLSHAALALQGAALLSATAGTFIGFAGLGTPEHQASRSMRFAFWCSATLMLLLLLIHWLSVAPVFSVNPNEPM